MILYEDNLRKFLPRYLINTCIRQTLKKTRKTLNSILSVETPHSEKFDLILMPSKEAWFYYSKSKG